MAFSDSMFLIEIIVEELRSYIKCKEFLVKSQFADIFLITLNDVNEVEKVFSKLPKKKVVKQKANVRGIPKFLTKASSLVPRAQTGQTIIHANDVESLITTMRNYPMELSLWSKLYPDFKIASTQIPWSIHFIEYLYKFNMGKNPKPISMKGEYKVFHEYSSRRMAVVKLNISLTSHKEKIFSDFSALTKIKDSQDAIYTGFYPGLTALSTIQQKVVTPVDIGIIKTIYSGNKKPRKRKRSKKQKLPDESEQPIDQSEDIFKIRETSDILNKKSYHSIVEEIEKIIGGIKVNSSILSLVKSDTEEDKYKTLDLKRPRSCSSMSQDHLNILNYIFGNNTGPFGDQVYCVNYCTVQNDPSSPGSEKTSSHSSKTSRLKLKKCDSECPNGTDRRLSFLSLDLPSELKDATLVKCKQVDCNNKEYRVLRTPPNEIFLVELTSLKQDCCDQAETLLIEKKLEKVEEVMGGMTAKMRFGDDPCDCECECQFGFVKKTTYCKICGGYEKEGEELAEIAAPNVPFPCPIYHKLIDKAKMKTSSLTGSETKKTTKKSVTERSIESEKSSKKSKKKKKENKFKFNYGYTAPQIGHSNCVTPCTGSLGPVPKKMGWLWTAEDIPGMKFRPNWKPGATNKHVVRLLKIAKDPGEVFAKKKRRKDLGKGKRPLKRPLLVVHKKDGEFNVTLETMKTYSKPRAINQVPYEDKPALTYTIGRTEEENRLRRKKKERARRRLERDQRKFIQSAFRDMCQEICLKTYQQALGILPDTESPDCPCYPADPGPDKADLDHSCSCSEEDLSGSDTDSDEWIVEFTPPTATYDATYKSKKVICNDSGTQYTYLDYRVKLLDRYGNPVPRYFVGLDGKLKCSDLGGFWSPDKKWLEINVDGYVAPDSRWVPNIFIGPDGETVDAESGKFQTMDGTWLVVGINGYVDFNKKWHYYPKSRAAPSLKNRQTVKVGVGSKQQSGKTGRAGGRGRDRKPKNSETTWSCFGNVSPNLLSEMGIQGHGNDRKLLLDTLKKILAQGQDVKLPKQSFFSRPRSKKGIKSKSVRSVRSMIRELAERRKCRHAPPSDKGTMLDRDGNKVYFKSKLYRNRRPRQRIAELAGQGISVSSFHVPCMDSFTNAELMMKAKYTKLMARAIEHGWTRPENRVASKIDTNKYRNIVV